MATANFVAVNGGICFSHGPYTSGSICPLWPSCLSDPQQEEFIKMGHDQVEAPEERQRLEREVIVRAKFWRKAQGDAEHVTEVDGMRLTVVRAWFGLRNAVDALDNLEAGHKVEG